MGSSVSVGIATMASIIRVSIRENDRVTALRFGVFITSSETVRDVLRCGALRWGEARQENGEYSLLSFRAWDFKQDPVWHLCVLDGVGFIWSDLLRMVCRYPGGCVLLKPVNIWIV